jgi:hypothetical protein
VPLVLLIPVAKLSPGVNDMQANLLPVSTTLAANLQLVSTTPVANNENNFLNHGRLPEAQKLFEADF